MPLAILILRNFNRFLFSDIMVIEDDLDYMDTLSDQSLQNQTLRVLGNQTNQSIEDVPCLCASSTVIHYISLNYHQRHHQQYQQQNIFNLKSGGSVHRAVPWGNRYSGSWWRRYPRQCCCCCCSQVLLCPLLSSPSCSSPLISRLSSMCCRHCRSQVIVAGNHKRFGPRIFVHFSPQQSLLWILESISIFSISICISSHNKQLATSEKFLKLEIHSALKY